MQHKQIRSIVTQHCDPCGTIKSCSTTHTSIISNLFCFVEQVLFCSSLLLDQLLHCLGLGLVGCYCLHVRFCKACLLASHAIAVCASAHLRTSRASACLEQAEGRRCHGHTTCQFRVTPQPHSAVGECEPWAETRLSCEGNLCLFATQYMGRIHSLGGDSGMLEKGWMPEHGISWSPLERSSDFGPHEGTISNLETVSMFSPLFSNFSCHVNKLLVAR